MILGAPDPSNPCLRQIARSQERPERLAASEDGWRNETLDTQNIGANDVNIHELPSAATDVSELDKVILVTVHLMCPYEVPGESKQRHLST